MKQIFVLAEHRKGQLRDTTWEAIAAGRKLAADLGVELSCLLLGSNTDAMAEILAKECPKVIAVDDPAFETFNSEPLTKALQTILLDRKPFMLIMCNSNSVSSLPLDWALFWTRPLLQTASASKFGMANHWRGARCTAIR